MAQKNMPGTPKQRSVSRPAQGRGGRVVVPAKPRNTRPLYATPSYRSTSSRSGNSLDVS